MKIVVCIKQVVDTNDIKWTKNNTIDRDGAQSIINPCDVLALEAALRLKDEHTKITVITMGPPQAKEALKTALAMGCDEAFLISDKKFSGSDTVATSKTLSTAIKYIQPDFDLIICGQYASDGDTAQTGPSIAQKLDIEQITFVNEIVSIQDNKITTQRTADEQIELIQTPLPALICINDCPYEPRHILIDGYIKAQDAEIKTLSAQDLNLSKDETGIKGSPTWVSNAFRATTTRERRIIFPKDITNNSTIEFLQEIINKTNSSAQKQITSVDIQKQYITDNDKIEQILIWGEVDLENNLIDTVFQLASKANILTQNSNNVKINVVTTGIKTEEYISQLMKYGVDKLITLQNSILNEYNTKNFASAILQYIEHTKPTIFLIGATKQGRDLAPQISSALSTGLTADCTGLKILENNQLAATRPTFGGELMATILCKTKPQMATIRPNVFETIEISPYTTPQNIVFPVEIKNPSNKKIIKSYPITKNEHSLENAKIVLSGGKGLKNKQTYDKLKELATLLNAQTGASRKAVDANFAAHEEQIGQTGKTISPELYIAFGISGAIQHTVGIQNAKKIIAINTNQNAPITQNADITIVEDAAKIIDEWITYLKSK